MLSYFFLHKRIKISIFDLYFYYCITVAISNLNNLKGAIDFKCAVKSDVFEYSGSYPINTLITSGVLREMCFKHHDLRENWLTRRTLSAFITGFDKQLIKESQKYFSRSTNGSVWSERLTCPRGTFTQETQHVHEVKRSHTAVLSEGWGVTLWEKNYSDLPHSLQLKFIPSVLFLRYVTPPLPPTSPLQLSMEGTPTQSHERDSH